MTRSLIVLALAAMTLMGLSLHAPGRHRSETAALTGVVSRSGGAPFPRAQVVVASLDDDTAGTILNADVDSDGRYRLSVPAGRYLLGVTDGDVASAMGGTWRRVVELHPGEQTVDLPEPQGVPVAGVVEGLPSPERVEVRLVPFDGGASNAVVKTHSSRTDSGGEFLFVGVRPGRYRLVARRGEPISLGGSGWISAISDLEVNGPLTDVRLPFPAGRLEGRIVDVRTGVPVANALVTLHRPAEEKAPYAHAEWFDSRVCASLRTDGEGRWSLDHAPEARLSIWIVADGYEGLESVEAVGGEIALRTKEDP